VFFLARHWLVPETERGVGEARPPRETPHVGGADARVDPPGAPLVRTRYGRSGIRGFCGETHVYRKDSAGERMRVSALQITRVRDTRRGH
jgi:hypothetical protein